MRRPQQRIAARTLWLALIVVIVIVGVSTWNSDVDSERPSLVGVGTSFDAGIESAAERSQGGPPLGDARSDIVPLEIPAPIESSSDDPSSQDTSRGDGLRLVVVLTPEPSTPACEIAESPPLVLTRPADGWTKTQPSRPRGAWNDLAAGAYVVTIDDPAWRCEPLEVDVERKRPVTRRDLVAEPLTRVSGTIVLATTGEAPEDARVVLETDVLRDREPEGLAHPETSGAFCLVGWSPSDEVRRVRVRVEVADHSPGVSPWVDVPDPHAFALTDLAFVLEDEAVLTGRITDARTGRQLSAEIRIGSLDHLNPWGRSDPRLAPTKASTRTDADGRYRLTTRAPADLALCVEARDCFWLSDALHVEPGETRNLDVELAGPASLVGRVIVEQPPTGVVPEIVRVMTASGEGVAGPIESARLEADGTFAFAELPAGRFVVSVFSNEIDRGMRVVCASREVLLVSGETAEVEFAIDAPSVSGHVFAPEGAQLFAICLDVDPVRQFGPVAPVDVAGRFTLSVAEPGEHLCAILGLAGDERVFAVVPFVVPADGSAATWLEIDVLRTRLELAPDPDAPWDSQSSDAILATLQPDTGNANVDRLLAESPFFVRDGEPIVVLGLPAGRYRLTWYVSGSAHALEPTEFVLREGVPERLVARRRID